MLKGITEIGSLCVKTMTYTYLRPMCPALRWEILLLIISWNKIYNGVSNNRLHVQSDMKHTCASLNSIHALLLAVREYLGLSTSVVCPFSIVNLVCEVNRAALESAYHYQTPRNFLRYGSAINILPVRLASSNPK